MRSSSGLPAGSVTFVFTDIEGSTRLLRRWGDRYADALEQHRIVLRRVWAAGGGVEVSVDGDACFVVFASADDALAGCAAAQRALADQRWPEGGELRVRIGIHTGTAFPRDGDYVALAVHQAARVVQAAHGGQIVVSQHSIDALSSAQPTGIVLADLGRYRLRDFDGPVTLFQVDGDGQSFPSVRAIPADQHNLTPVGTTFVGRTQELDDVRRRLTAGRLTSLVGTGGVGKTRLATELGMLVAPGWADGVWMVDLSTVTDPALVVPTVAAALGLQATGTDRRCGVLDALVGHRAVVVLDNCEQVIEECAAFVGELLAHCPSVAVLATSREPLGVAGEVVYRLAPLRVVDDATTLFLDRMGADAGDSADRDLIAKLCQRCDRIPLAIELAASRCGVMSVAEIVAGLDERFRLLRTRGRALPERQRTMTAVLDWSYELLSPDERAALERLSVFGGSFDVRGATAAVAHGGIDGYDVPELVWSLTEKSLLTSEPAANATRYRMLETVRAYAGRRLEARDDTSSITAATTLAAWLVQQFPLANRGDRTWLGRLALEVDTVTALISSIAPEEPSLPALARLRGELRSVSGNPRLGWEEIDAVLARLADPTPGSARLMLYAASLMGDSGEVDEAFRRCDLAESILDQLGETDQWGPIRPTSPRPTLLLRSERHEDLVRAEALAQAAADATTTDAERADALLRLAMTRSALDLDGVADLYEEVVVLGRRAPDHVVVALALNNLAETELRRGLVGRAADHQRAALTYAAELGMEHVVSFGLIASARIAESVGSPTLAVHLHTVAERRLADSGVLLYPDDQALSDAMLDRIVATMGPAAFADARRSGELLDAEQALAEADAVLLAASVGPVGAVGAWRADDGSPAAR